MQAVQGQRSITVTFAGEADVRFSCQMNAPLTEGQLLVAGTEILSMAEMIRNKRLSQQVQLSIQPVPVSQTQEVPQVGGR